MLNLSRPLAAAALALALLAGPVVLAQHPGGPPGQQQPTPPRPSPSAAPGGGGVLRLLPPPSTTRHTARVGGEGRALDYVATAGTLPLRDGQGETMAELFHVAYVADPPRPERPVTFVFNGGPGAASAFLNLGGLGPRAVAFSGEGGFLPPPARLVDNPDTWLDFTDLVFVDPVGTGYSRAAGEGEEADRRFFGVRQDASAMAAFIRLWLARAGRALSPVFLAGESYGGFRAAVLARALPEESGIAPSGAVLISPAIEFSLLRGEDHDLLPPALALPSLAAVHLERQGVAAGGDGLASRLAEVERFALSDYLVALAAGSRGVTPALEATLARATGLPPDVVARGRGRVSVSRFIKEYDRAAGRVLSRYDGSLGGPDPDPTSPEPRGPDPVLDRAVPAWTQAFVGHVRGELRYETDVTYRLLSQEVNGKWDYGTGPSRQGHAGALDDLQAGRVLNPAIEVLVAHGYTDLVTPYLASRYLLDQLPPLAGAAPVAFRVYPGGHMMYTRPGSRRALARDARALYERAAATAAAAAARP